MTIASAPLARLDPLATTVQRPVPTLASGTPTAYIVLIRRSVTGLVFPAGIVSRETTAYPSIAARSASGTSMGERTSSAGHGGGRRRSGPVLLGSSGGRKSLRFAAPC